MFLCGVEIKEDKQLMCENRSDLNEWDDKISQM